MTHTYALLEVSPAVYNEVREKLVAAGYTHAIGVTGELDMHGIALCLHPILHSGPAESIWVEDIEGADRYARNNPKAPDAPAHWHRCNYLKDGVRCRKVRHHEDSANAEIAAHEEPKA